jgi:hypothetical protein
MVLHETKVRIMDTDLLQVKRGDYPVLGAKVEVTAIHPAMNGSSPHKEKFELLDTGSGGEWVCCDTNHRHLNSPVFHGLGGVLK